jgi:hypothetical protein
VAPLPRCDRLPHGAPVAATTSLSGRGGVVAGLPQRWSDMGERIMIAIVFTMLALFFFALLVVPHVPFLAGAD